MTIPDGWTKKKLAEIAVISSGATPSRSDATYWNGNIPWITTAEVNFNTIIDTKEKITSFGLNNSSAKLFPINTLLIAMYGQGKTRGKVAKLGIQATTNQACAAIIISKDYSHEFYFSYLEFKYDFLRSLSNAGGQENLSTSIIKSIIIPVPPLPEQIKIADILSTWDGAIEAQEKLITNSETLKKGLMQQLLTGEKRLNGFSGAWEEKKLGEVLDYIQPTKYLVQDTNYKLSGTPVLTAGKSFILGYTNENFGIFENNLPVIIFDDFTTATKFVNFSFKVKSTAMKILIARNDDIRFTYELIQMIKYEIGGHERHWISKFANILVLLPPLPEQTAIANILSDADREIALQKQKLFLLKQEKTALMQDLLTGKRRVNVDINLKEEVA